MKLPEPFVYFVDRSLGRGIVVETLRATGHEVHAHDDLFAQDTPDTASGSSRLDGASGSS